MYKIMILSAAILLGGFVALRATRKVPATPAIHPKKGSLSGQPAGNSFWQLLPAASQIQWKATYITGGGHEGTLQLKGGVLQAGNFQLITTGRFVIDMTSIRSTDLPDEKGRHDLEEHLKSNDFFATGQFPLATFSVTGSTPFVPASVTGNLSIKDVSHPVSIPFVWHVQNDTLIVQGQLTIDRTKWGINYHSEGVLGSLKDGVISDKVELSLQLRFSKPKQGDGC